MILRATFFKSAHRVNEWGFIDNWLGGRDNCGVDTIGIAILSVVLSVPVLLFVWWRWQRARVEVAKGWPTAEATIQYGRIEVVSAKGLNTVRLPAFAFSYQVQGEYYSGRFALMPFTVQYDEYLINRMGGTCRLLRSGTPGSVVYCGCGD